MKIVILCGGKGTRLSEETRVTPKPMVKIGGKPILSHILDITKGLINNSIKIARNTNLSTLPKHWSSLLESIFEIENVSNSTSLDIEFGITNSKKIVIFQVRPITSLKSKSYSDSEIFKIIKNYKITFKEKKKDFNIKNEPLNFSDKQVWDFFRMLDAA